MKKSMVCIICPMGCQLSVETENAHITVSGNTCMRGEKYAKDELTCPKRTITSTIAVDKGTVKRLPVATSKPISKDKIDEVMKVIHKLKISAPINLYDIILKDICQSGADLIATRTVERNY